MLKSAPRFEAFTIALTLLVALTAVAASAANVAPTTAPAAADVTTPRERAMAFMAAGNQRAAERVIEDLLHDAKIHHVRPHVEDAFFAAVCRRSRFEVEQAAPLFRFVNEANSFLIHGQASGLILALDDRTGNVERDFVALDQLSARNPSDPLLLWMVAVQCRALNKPQVGVERYAMLCELWVPGPVLVHQTYANLLDALHRPEDSLVHRQIAVKLEPQSWSYDGLAQTLSALRRWDEADAAFAQATSRGPNQSWLWNNWALSKQARGDVEGTAKLMAKVEELNAAAPPERK